MNRDERALDEAIDAVAKGMVDVPADADLAMRIAQSLPDRRWRLAWLVPQLALASAVVIALVLWNTGQHMAPTLPALPSLIADGFGTPATVKALTPGYEPERLRTPPSVPLEPVEPSVPLQVSETDFERALPAVGALSVLEVGDIAPRELPAAGELALSPIDIGVLPLTADVFIPRK